LTLKIFLDSASQVPQFWTYGKDVPIVTGFVTGTLLPRFLISFSAVWRLSSSACEMLTVSVACR
jgi:hypothetical protein